MSTSTRKHTVVTSHGALAVEERGEGGLPVLLIHGNSFCRDVFRHQLQGRLAEKHRVIAFDLPGHGQSSNAVDPTTTYALGGLADAALELLDRLAVTEVIVFGWSLGGHIGIHMLSRFPGMRGLMITGSPPVPMGGMAQGFNAGPHMALAGKQDVSNTEIESFIHAIFGDGAEPFLRDAVARADGRFRKRLFEAARAGDGVDQRMTVESSPVPIAVVNGREDPVIKLDYFDTVAFGHLWEGQCHRLPGVGHVPFWSAPTDFNPILERFVRDVDIG
ncbi:alpha/beta fold hydrolase [Pendulispora rubella]|uniref:Alpha/beta fold hydrolase n=1 Tax=Pendulispora rubella TaxID=2741070 RepID=A0ABZ2KXD2_9BACT